MRLVFSIIAFVLAPGCTVFNGQPGASASSDKNSATEVPAVTLHIDLQDGFHNDEVVIKLDGKQIYKKAGVSTDVRISRADGIEATTTKAEALVEVELPKKRIKASQKLKAGQTPNVGISVQGGTAQIRAQAEVFLYM